MHFTHSFKDFEKYTIGFDKVFEDMSKLFGETYDLAKKYPPYNIVKVDENRWQLEMAVAGFGKQQIDIELDGKTLSIKGNTSKDEDEPTYLYNGIANRAFTRTFRIADNVEVQTAELANGILKIWLNAITPEQNKPTKVEIKGE